MDENHKKMVNILKIKVGKTVYIMRRELKQRESAPDALLASVKHALYT